MAKLFILTGLSQETGMVNVNVNACQMCIRSFNITIMFNITF